MFWLLAVFLLLGSTATPVDRKEEGVARLEWFQKKAKKPVIKISGTEFKKYVTKGPRPYHVFVILTAKGKASNCALCRELDPTIREVADMAKTQRDKDPDQSNPLFVVEVDYASSPGIFKEMGLKSAPVLRMVPATTSLRTIALANFAKQVGRKNEYNLMKGKKLEDILNWINERTNKDIKKPPELPLKMILVIGGIFVGLGVFGMMCYDMLGFLNKMRKNLAFYTISFSGLFAFCTSGGMYNGIRNTPWMGAKDGKPEWINRQLRGQHGIESAIVGGLYASAGLGIVCLVHLLRAGYTGGAKKSRFIACPTFVPLAALLVAWYAVVAIYTLKNTHYRMGWVGMTG